MKWKEKYSKILHLYAGTVGNKSEWIPLKRSLPVIVKAPQKRVKKATRDPLQTFDANIQQLILQHLTGKDFVKMTEVSNQWKEYVEENDLLMNVDLNINLTTQNIDKRGTTEALMLSKRNYNTARILFDDSTKNQCFTILTKFSRSLEEVIMSQIKPRSIFNTRLVSFPNLRVLKIQNYVGNDICEFLCRSNIQNLQILHIKRRGFHEGLACFICGLSSLKELHITADDMFYHAIRKVAEDDFEDFDEESDNESMEFALENLVIGCDENESTPIHLFESQLLLTSLAIYGLNECTSVAIALRNFGLLTDLTLYFNVPIMNGVVLINDIDEMFDEILETNTSVHKLVLGNIDGVPDDFLTNLFLAVPNVIILFIEDSVVNSTFVDFAIASLPNLQRIIRSSNGKTLVTTIPRRTKALKPAS